MAAENQTKSETFAIDSSVDLSTTSHHHPRPMASAYHALPTPLPHGPDQPPVSLPKVGQTRCCESTWAITIRRSSSYVLSVPQIGPCCRLTCSSFTSTPSSPVTSRIKPNFWSENHCSPSCIPTNRPQQTRTSEACYRAELCMAR
jgi:hypothetical protein